MRSRIAASSGVVISLVSTLTSSRSLRTGRRQAGSALVGIEEHLLDDASFGEELDGAVDRRAGETRKPCLRMASTSSSASKTPPLWESAVVPVAALPRALRPLRGAVGLCGRLRRGVGIHRAAHDGVEDVRARSGVYFSPSDLSFRRKTAYSGSMMRMSSSPGSPRRNGLERREIHGGRVGDVGTEKSEAGCGKSVESRGGGRQKDS